MKTSETPVSNSHFSWSRILMVARYYRPRLRVQMILYPIVSLAVFGIAAVADSAGWSGTLAASAFSWLSWLVVFAPLAFAAGGSDRRISAVLPVRGVEKCAFLLIYCFAVVPAIVYLPAKIAGYLYFGDPSMGAMVDPGYLRYGFTDMFVDTAQLLGMVSMLAQTATCLWIVVASSSRQALRAVAGVLSLNMVLGMVTALAGIMYVAGNVDAAGQMSKEEFTSGLIGDMQSWMSHIIIPVMAIYAIFALWMACRAVCRKQY